MRHDFSVIGEGLRHGEEEYRISTGEELRSTRRPHAPFRYAART